MMFLLALPTWIKVAVVSAAVIGVLQLQHWWTVRSLRRDLAQIQQQLDQEKAATADLRVALSDVQGNRDKLTAMIQQQNAAIEALRTEARQIETAASLRVARAIRAGEEAARALRAETTQIPPGHDAMNAWLQERLTP